MRLTIENVIVTNWSKNPMLRLSSHQQARLGQAIRYARQIASDSVDLLTDFMRARDVAAADAQMARDYFGTHDAVAEALPKYFGLDVGPAGAPAGGTAAQVANRQTANTILNKFRQIHNGIKGQFEIVVGKIFDGDDLRDGLSDAAASLRQGAVRGAVQDLKFISTGTRGWVNPHHALARIHLNRSVLDSDSAGYIARTIVHEASHKFANTDDVDVTGAGPDTGTGYKWDGLKHNAKGYIGLENNADSYAWGGRLMWKRKRRLPSGT